VIGAVFAGAAALLSATLLRKGASADQSEEARATA
jgi:hypothetical protein